VWGVGCRIFSLRYKVCCKGFMLQRSGFTFQGSGFTFQDLGFTFQGSGIVFQGSGFVFQGSGFMLQGSGFMLQGLCSGFRLQGFCFRVQGLRFKVQGLCSGFRVYVSGFRVYISGFTFRVQGLCSGFRIHGSGFRTFSSGWFVVVALGVGWENVSQSVCRVCREGTVRSEWMGKARIVPREDRKREVPAIGSKALGHLHLKEQAQTIPQLFTGTLTAQGRQHNGVLLRAKETPNHLCGPQPQDHS